MYKVQTPKTLFFLNFIKFAMISKFNIHTVHLKYFGSIRHLLNEYKTWTKNLNHGLKKLWISEKNIYKSKQQKQH